MMRHRFYRQLNAACCAFVVLASTSYGFTSYYLSSAGSDGNKGTSAAAPWKSIEKVNGTAFAPGDAILFRSGDRFNGQITVNQSRITIGSYGGSAKPIISGGERLAGWTVYRGSIYQTKAPAVVKNLFSNGAEMTLARYPNKGAWLKVATSSSPDLKSSESEARITAAWGLTQPNGTWTGANIRVRSTQYTYETRQVSAYAGGTITLPGHPNVLVNHIGNFSYGVPIGYGFYLDNALAALDAPGEWFCDRATNIVYFYAPGGVNPASLTVIGSVYDYGVNSSGSMMTVQGLDFRYQSVSGIRFSGKTRGNRILSNRISSVLMQGVEIDGTSSDCRIDGNTLQNIDGRAIYLENSTSSFISNNAIRNIGLIPGIGIDNEHGGTAILIMGGQSDIVRANTMDSLGGQGIRLNGSYHLIENNVIRNCMLTISDGGAINSYNEDGLSFAQTWRNNIVINVIGGGLESSNSKNDGDLVTNGLYWDYRSHDMIAEGNTVTNVVHGPGLYMQYGCYNNTVRNNTFYNNNRDHFVGTHSVSIRTDGAYSYGGHRIAGNIFFSENERNAALNLTDLSPTYHAVGSFDSNYYCTPTPALAIARVWKPKKDNALDRYSLSQWQTFSKQDAHSRELTQTAGSHLHDTLVVNSTGSPIRIVLPSSTYRDVKGAVVSSSLSLAPYSSRILIRASMPFLNENVTSVQRVKRN